MSDLSWEIQRLFLFSMNCIFKYHLTDTILQIVKFLETRRKDNTKIKKMLSNKESGVQKLKDFTVNLPCPFNISNIIKMLKV